MVKTLKNEFVVVNRLHMLLEHVACEWRPEKAEGTVILGEETSNIRCASVQVDTEHIIAETIEECRVYMWGGWRPGVKPGWFRPYGHCRLGILCCIGERMEMWILSRCSCAMHWDKCVSAYLCFLNSPRLKTFNWASVLWMKTLKSWGYMWYSTVQYSIS